MLGSQECEAGDFVGTASLPQEETDGVVSWAGKLFHHCGWKRQNKVLSPFNKDVVVSSEKQDSSSLWSIPAMGKLMPVVSAC